MYRDENDENIIEIKVADEEDQKTEEMNDDHKDENSEEVAEDDRVETREETSPADQNVFEQLQRLKAEFANYKKRKDAEQIELADIIKSEFITKLLPVLDDFDRLLEHIDGDYNAENYNELVKGMKLIHQKLIETLKEQGLEEIKAVGEKFDPNFHEALVVEHREDMEDDMVIEEWRKGYIFKDRLLRPAQVKVNKKTGRAGDSYA